MREKTACFTGHRKIPPESISELSQRLKNTLLRLIEEGYMYFGAGGASGFDTLATQCVLSLKKQYPHIKLILVLPCITQTKGGTAYTVNYARQSNVQVINLAAQ